MNKAFIDTTILTDALLKPGKVGMQAKAALRRYEVTELPVYAIKEFKAGPLKNFVWFHNKLALTKSLTKSLQALQRMSLSPKRYTVATAIEALQAAAHKNKNLSTADLVERYGDTAKWDTVACDRYRLAIRVQIERAWKQRRKITSHIVIPLHCYKEHAPVEENGVLNIEPTKCNPEKECCLSPILKGRPDDLRRLKEALDSQSPKPENKRRRRVLRALFRTPKRPMTEKMCRDLGDAFFTLFAPSDSVILTTNLRDHEPLAEALEKKVEAP
jgi:hypothetical protein